MLTKTFLKLTKNTMLPVWLFIMVFSSGKLIAQKQTPEWVPPSAIAIKNPVLSTPESLKAIKTTYVTYCSPCHGEKGRGDGVAAATLAVRPADHSGPAVQKQTDGALFYELSEGHNPMPAYKASLTETQRWQLINYIRTLAKTSKK